MSDENEAPSPTPEERAQHVYDATIWQYIETRDPNAESIIASHIAAEIRAAIAEATRWIPVSERLPTLGERVLVYIPSDIEDMHPAYRSEYKDGNNGFCGTIKYHLRSVTHWQPPPPAPTEASE